MYFAFQRLECNLLLPYVRFSVQLLLTNENIWEIGNGDFQLLISHG